MDIPPHAAAHPRPRPLLERALFGVAGVGAAGLALWLTALSAFIDWLARCDDLVTWQAFAGAVGMCAALASAATLVWGVSVSFFRVGAGRRGLRRRSWIVAPIAVVGFTLSFVVVVPAPSPASESCRLDLH